MNYSPDRHSFILEIETSWRRERPDLELSNFLLAIYLTRLGRIVDDAADRLFGKRFGISGADMRVLFALRRAGKPFMRRPTDLFRALRVTSGAITKQVDRLSKKGLVERISRENQLGGVQLTAKGLKMADAATDNLGGKAVDHRARCESIAQVRALRRTAVCPTHSSGVRSRCSSSGTGRGSKRDTPKGARALPERMNQGFLRSDGGGGYDKRAVALLTRVVCTN